MQPGVVGTGMVSTPHVHRAPMWGPGTVADVVITQALSLSNVSEPSGHFRASQGGLSVLPHGCPGPVPRGCARHWWRNSVRGPWPWGGAWTGVWKG